MCNIVTKKFHDDIRNEVMEPVVNEWFIANNFFGKIRDSMAKKRALKQLKILNLYLDLPSERRITLLCHPSAKTQKKNYVPAT